MDAQTAAEETIEKARGRKDATGQPAVMKTGPVKDRVKDLIELYVAMGEAQDKFNTAIKATAEKAGMLSSVVRKYVVARAGENFEEEARKVEQLSLVFDTLGDGKTKGPAISGR